MQIGTIITNEAIISLKTRLQQGLSIDSYTYVGVLKQKDIIATKEVHNCIIRSGMERNIYVASNLISAYIRCGSLQERQVFDALVKKDLISWNIMIGGYAQHNHSRDAMEIFHQMLQEGVQPEAYTYVSVLKACASPLALKWGKEVHAYIRHGGLESNVRAGNALLMMYAKYGNIKKARQAFDTLINQSLISWNLMVKAYAESGCGNEAYEVFFQMQQDGFKSDAITYLSIINPSASTLALEQVKVVHCLAFNKGLELGVRVGSTLVLMYAKSGSVDDT